MVLVGAPSPGEIAAAFRVHGIDLGTLHIAYPLNDFMWDNMIDSDPFFDIRAGVLWMVEQSGYFPEVIVMGSKAMLLLMRTPDFIQRGRSCSKRSLEDFCGHRVEGIGPALNWPPQREFGVNLSSAVIFLGCPPIKFSELTYVSTHGRFKEEITHSYILFVGATV